MLRRILVPVGALAGITGAFFGIAWLTSHRPALIEPVQVTCGGIPRALRPGDTFTLLSWNLQYGASRKYHFFYDGGPDVRPSRGQVDWTLNAVSSALRDLKPDLALLQEIDRDSDRTFNLDQLQPYLSAMAPACWTATPYHKVPYLPHPTHDFLGKVDTELGTLSQLTIQDSTRYQLALLKEPFWRRMFNLKRALHEVRIPVEGGALLRVGNTHLSAFSYGDGSLEQQVAALKDWMGRDQSWILAGDFNMLPPGDDASRLKTEAELYADAVNPISALIPAFKTAVPLEDMLDPRWRTYLPFGYAEPDRKIDYVFYGSDLEVLSVDVLREYSEVSDHLPMRVVFRLKGGAEEETGARSPADAGEGALGSGGTGAAPLSPEGSGGTGAAPLSPEGSGGTGAAPLSPERTETAPSGP